MKEKFMHRSKRKNFFLEFCLQFSCFPIQFFGEIFCLPYHMFMRMDAFAVHLKKY